MPSFSNYPTPPSIKAIYIGHSGAGKTGSLVSLAAAGFNVRVLDLDGKAEVIRDFVYNPKSIYRKERAGLWTQDQANSVADRISYVTITEGFNIQGVNAIPKGDSFQKINQQLNDWRDGEDKPGNISKWSSNDVLVIDSLSRFCESAMNFHLSLNGRLVSGPKTGTSSDNDYSAAYRLINNFLQLLKSSDISCHIILTCHIDFMRRTLGPQTSVTSSEETRGFPQVFFTNHAKISPAISQFFPHVIRAKSQGNYPSIKRVIVTNNDESIELITPAPLRVKQEYPLETGLAEYFRDVRTLPEGA